LYELIFNCIFQRVLSYSRRQTSMCVLLFKMQYVITYNSHLPSLLFCVTLPRLLSRIDSAASSPFERVITANRVLVVPKVTQLNIQRVATCSRHTSTAFLLPTVYKTISLGCKETRSCAPNVHYHSAELPV